MLLAGAGLALLYPLCTTAELTTLLALGAALGFLFLPAYPLLLEMSGQLAGPAAAGAATSLLMLAGNAGGVAVVVAMPLIKGDRVDYQPAIVLLVALLAVTVALASRAHPVKDGFGKLTYLKGATAYEPGKWYHVAGVYDGNAMRLYVNGKLDATSDEQKGDILYAPTAPFVVGRYRDADEDTPLTGALREVLLCPRAVPADEIAAHFAADGTLGGFNGGLHLKERLLEHERRVLGAGS